MRRLKLNRTVGSAMWRVCAVVLFSAVGAVAAEPTPRTRPATNTPRTYLEYKYRGVREDCERWLNDGASAPTLQGEEVTVAVDGDTISIVPSIAGGSTASAVPAQTTLSNDEIHRYSRHLIIPEVGMEGQKKLKEASVLCIGAGGLGSPVTMYLSAAGVGRLGIVDFDIVDFSNLQRQVIHSTDRVGQRKIDSARATLTGINPNVLIETYETALTSANALGLFEGYDLVVDGTDNFPTRYLVNDACVLSGKPNVYGSIFRFQGQASDIDIHAREILKIRDQLNKILSDHTGQPIEKIGEDTERDNFMSSADAAAYGIIDEVLNTRT